jgi:V/A-type H+-transporting ATPase subunit E
MVEDKLPAHGVQALIERLRAEGVEAGRQEAEKILAEARAQAERILAEAQAQAEGLVAQAKRTQAKLESASREALALAVRDAKLRLQEELSSAFDRKLAELVRQAMRPQPFLEQLILHVAGKVSQDLPPGPITLVLPSEPATLEALRQAPEATDPMTHLALRIAQEMLREGVTLKIGTGFAAGIRIELGEGAMLDLSDEALSQLLLAHLRPRFRLLLEGVVRAGE